MTYVTRGAQIRSLFVDPTRERPERAPPILAKCFSSVSVLAQSSQQLNFAVASLTVLQSSFMRSAADADANIGLSKAHSLLPVGIVDARTIDNTVNDDHRNGLPAALRDLRPSKPTDLATDTNRTEYGATDPRHAASCGYA